MKTILTILFFLQITDNSKLTNADRDHLLISDTFELITDVNMLPEYVKQSFAKIEHEKTFSMANPGKEYQVTDVVKKVGLPHTRLVLAGLSNDHCFLHYEKGGRGHSYRIILFRLNNGKAHFIWSANSWSGYEKLDSLRNAIKSMKFDDSKSFIW